MKEESSTKDIPLIGVWKLIPLKSAGKVKNLFPFGRDAKGLLIYTDVGRFSAQLMRFQSTKFVSGDQVKGTVERRCML